MQIAFKEQRPGEFAWNRELLSGGEWTADSGEKQQAVNRGPAWSPGKSLGSHCLGKLRPRLSSRQGGSPWEASL